MGMQLNRNVTEVWDTALQSSGSQHHHHHHHHRHQRNPEKMRRVGAVMIAVFAVLAVVGLLIAGSLEQHNAKETREEQYGSFGKLPTMEYKGRTYRMKSDVTPVLLIGYDKRTEGYDGYRDGGQSDYLLLLVIDHREKTVRQLQIDRDTLAEITVIGITGRASSQKRLQIALSHSYGKSIEQTDAFTVDAVSRLLGQLPEGLTMNFISMGMHAVQKLNNVLGGVTVTIEDDFTEFFPEMYVGATLTLTDEMAEVYIRGRMSIGDGTNVARMRRQRGFMNSAVNKLRSNLKASSAYAGDLLDGMDAVIHTNMSRGQLINELNRSARYKMLPVETFDGEHTLDNLGFTAFIADPESIAGWVVNAFYNPIE